MAGTEAHVPLIVGAKYSSFAALQVAISDHENSHFVQYFKRNSRTIESFQRHYPSKRELRIPQIIEYPELDYACIHGGKPFRSKANQRPKQSSFRMSCPAGVKVRLSDDAMFLVVKSIVEEHCHPTTEVNPDLDLGSVGLPPPIPKRGRPKGTETTVIGIPRKRRRLATRPMPFINVSSSEKEHMILGWLVSPVILPAVIEGEQLVEITDLLPWHQMPNKVSDNEKVTLEKVIRYFTKEAWIAVNKSVKQLKENGMWLCKGCSTELSGSFAICCDCCLEWYDRKCAGLKMQPKSRLWFCRSCYGCHRM